MYRDCIAPANHSDSWATMDTVSEPEARGTAFRAIPELILKIINEIKFLKKQCEARQEIMEGIDSVETSKLQKKITRKECESGRHQGQSNQKCNSGRHTSRTTTRTIRRGIYHI